MLLTLDHSATLIFPTIYRNRSRNVITARNPQRVEYQGEPTKIFFRPSFLWEIVTFSLLRVEA